MCALSGPSFAREVASGLPTDVVVASKSAEAAAEVAEALHSPMFRVYTSKDPVGVEVGGAMKNVLAIAAGACDGLGMGTNARAALVTRGLSEMARLGVALGGDPLTFMGLSGVGDLILTSTGALSRNRALGMKVAEGIDPGKYLASQRTVAEGYLTARAAWRLAQKLGVDVPITEQVYHVLHEGRPLLDAMKMLLTRAQKDELWGLPGCAPVGRADAVVEVEAVHIARSSPSMTGSRLVHWSHSGRRSERLFRTGRQDFLYVVSSAFASALRRRCRPSGVVHQCCGIVAVVGPALVDRVVFRDGACVLLVAARDALIRRLG